MKRKDFIKNSSLSLLGGITTFNAQSKSNRQVRDVGHDPNGIEVYAPSILKVNETFNIGIRILCDYYYVDLGSGWNRPNPSIKSPFNLSPRGTHYMDNVPPNWKGSVRIISSDDYEGPNEFSFTNGKGPYEQDERPIRRLEGFKFSKPGTKYIHVISSESNLEGMSNPIYVESEPKERLFWGDLHNHSIYTDAIRNPEEMYRFAKDEMFLDIFAMSDHSEGLTDSNWENFSAIANEYYNPNQFVTFIGGEWTNMTFGHHNYYYLGDKGPRMSSVNPKTEDLKQLYALARSHQALIIPHHTAQKKMGTDWNLGHDIEVERLVEIYSSWGNSECSAANGNPRPIRFMGGERKSGHVLQGLKKGYRLGFIGGGDTHDGRPGDSSMYLQRKPKGYNLLYPQGIMGVWAKELTRESIFNALWNRHVYATTNHRTLLKFLINGKPMGSEITVMKDCNVRFEIEAVCNREIDHVDLICEGQKVQEIHPKSGEELKVNWRNNEKVAVTDETWYYVRLSLKNSTDMAWSSPIWINIE